MSMIMLLSKWFNVPFICKNKSSDIPGPLDSILIIMSSIVLRGNTIYNNYVSEIKKIINDQGWLYSTLDINYGFHVTKN